MVPEFEPGNSPSLVKCSLLIFRDDVLVSTDACLCGNCSECTTAVGKLPAGHTSGRLQMSTNSTDKAQIRRP